MKAMGLLFPGQGAQVVGMGRDLAEGSAAARQVFDAAERATGVDIAAPCFDGPLETLSRSDVAQPAILTVSIAALRALAEAAGAPLHPAAGGGLSLGEYSALVAADAISFADAVRLVLRRGRYMQEACDARPGAMHSVIGLDDARVEQACARAREETGAGVWPANYNSPGQLVISGEEPAAEAAARACAAMGARRTIRLQVAGAFHTPMMQPAADRLAADLDTVEIRSPRWPVVANVTARAVAGPDEIRDLLVRQVTSPVRWTACMHWLLERGMRDFYEIGPGRVLQGLLKRTSTEAVCRTVNGLEDVRACAQAAST